MVGDQQVSSEVGMSALGQKRTFREVWPMSALPPKADIAERAWHVRFVPISEMKRRPTEAAPAFMRLAVLRTPT
jgi:hypothetical protein